MKSFIAVLSVLGSSLAIAQISGGSCGSAGCVIPRVPSVEVDAHHQRLQVLMGYFTQVDAVLDEARFSVAYEFENFIAADGSEGILRLVRNERDEVVEKCAYLVKAAPPTIQDPIATTVRLSGCYEIP